MAAANFCRPGGATSDNKGYALHSLAVVRATPHRGEKTAATSHNQDVNRHAWRTGTTVDAAVLAAHLGK